MIPSDFHTNQTFGLAAARAFGLDPDRVTSARVDTSDFDDVLSIRFEIALLPDDLVRIGQEMARIDGEEIDAAVKANAALAELQDETQGVGERTVQHLDIGNEPEPDGLPPHVWLYRNMLTDLQRLAPLGIDETNGQYAVACDDLTDEQQRVPHIKQQLEQRTRDADEAARPLVPYDHVWRRHHSYRPQKLGTDWVYYGDFVAWPWADLDEKHRVDLKMIPANTNDSQNQPVI